MRPSMSPIPTKYSTRKDTSNHTFILTALQKVIIIHVCNKDIGITLTCFLFDIL